MLVNAKKFAKFCVLSGVQQRQLAMSLLLLPAFWLGLRILGFQRFNEWITRSPGRGKQALTFEEISYLGSLINSATFHVLGPDNCLTRSMYLLWLLRRLGIMSDLRIGMRLMGGQLEAHAWVEVAGQPVNEAEDISERFAPFDRPFPPRLVSLK